MFKNEISLSQSYVLSKKEKKEISKLLLKKYDEKHIDHIMKNYQNWTIHKITGGKKRIIFCDGNPLFFEYDIDLFYPTIYVLNAFPYLLKDKICYIYDETNSFLNKGADLMLNGIINKDEIKDKIRFKLNDAFSVQTVSG
jgi:predicted ribosome-associated RNA-binding protein Tma20